MSTYLELHNAIGAFLLEHRALWAERAFCDREAPWLPSDLRDTLFALSAEEIKHVRAHLSEAATLHPRLAELWSQACAFEAEVDALPDSFRAVENAPRPHLNERSQRYVPERKLRQIAVLQTRLAEHPPTGTLIDWCGGKGHLSRNIAAHFGVNARVLERSTAVIHDGRSLSESHEVPLTFFEVDVLSADSLTLQRAFGDAHTGLALHACGELSAVFLEEATRSELQQLLVIPCCPHVTGQHSHWRALSASEHAEALALTTPDLKLAIADDVVAPERVRQQRQREQLWRLCADLYFRQELHRSAYVTVGVLPSAAFRVPLEDFMALQCEKQALTPPTPAALTHLLEQAREELRLVHAAGIVRAMFRRPLELYTVFDRAAYLQSTGWDVRVERVFQRSSSPRNLMIFARRL